MLPGEKLDTLVYEVAGADEALCNEAMEELEDEFDALSESVNDYIDSATTENAESAQTVLNALGYLLSRDSDAGMKNASNEARLEPVVYVPGAGRLTDLDDDQYKQSADRLDSAVKASENKQTKPSTVSYTTAYNTEDAEAVIALFCTDAAL